VIRDAWGLGLLVVSEHFTGRHTAKQRVNVDFPLALLRMIDAECEVVGISRQAWIKMACDERLWQIQEGREREKRIRQWDEEVAEGYARIPPKPEEAEIWQEEQAWGEEWDENIVLVPPAGTDDADQNK
jgi:hypothetical protein